MNFTSEQNSIIKINYIECAQSQHVISFICIKLKNKGIISGVSFKDKYDILGIYDTMEALLESTAIDNRKFKDVIMDDDTIIDSKD